MSGVRYFGAGCNELQLGPFSWRPLSPGAAAFRGLGTLLESRRLIPMSTHEQERIRAERLFKARELQKTYATKVIADYYAAEQRTRDRTQELRRLRLAREKQSSHAVT